MEDGRFSSIAACLPATCRERNRALECSLTDKTRMKSEPLRSGSRFCTVVNNMSTKYLVYYHRYVNVGGIRARNLKTLCEQTTGVISNEADIFGQCVVCYRNSGSDLVEWREVVDGPGSLASRK